jgi:hypothetical protein
MPITMSTDAMSMMPSSGSESRKLMVPAASSRRSIG